MIKYTTANGRLVLLNPNDSIIYSARYVNDRPTYGHILFRVTSQTLSAITSSGSLSEVQPSTSR